MERIGIPHSVIIQRVTDRFSVVSHAVIKFRVFTLVFPYYGVPVRISGNQVRKDNNQHNAPGDGERMGGDDHNRLDEKAGRGNSGKRGGIGNTETGEVGMGVVSERDRGD